MSMLPTALGELEQAGAFLKQGTDPLSDSELVVVGHNLDAGFRSLIRAVSTLIAEVQKHEATIEELKAGTH